MNCFQQLLLDDAPCVAIFQKRRREKRRKKTSSSWTTLQLSLRANNSIIQNTFPCSQKISTVPNLSRYTCENELHKSGAFSNKYLCSNHLGEMMPLCWSWNPSSILKRRGLLCFRKIIVWWKSSFFSLKKGNTHLLSSKAIKKPNGFRTKKITKGLYIDLLVGDWTNPIWKMCSSNWIISPRIGVKMSKHL